MADASEVVSWRGKRLEDMSREDLITAIKDAGRIIREMTESEQRQRALHAASMHRREEIELTYDME